MKTLFLIRHAKSSWKFDTAEDFDRPLNKRGERDAPEMADRLKKKGVLPDIIVSSSALRAKTTAGLFAESLGYDQKSIILIDDLYLADPFTILETVKALNESHESAMLFAHNPGITELVNMIDDVDIDNVPTAGVSTIEFNAESWADVSINQASLSDFDYPKLT